jgi:hypothetical protein
VGIAYTINGCCIKSVPFVLSLSKAGQSGLNATASVFALQHFCHLDEGCSILPGHVQQEILMFVKE